MSDTKALLLEFNSLALSLWFKENVKSKKDQLMEAIGSADRAILPDF